MISTAIDGFPLRDREQDWPPLSEPEHRPLHRAILSALGPLHGQRLLDVGCGVGLFLRAAEHRGALVAGTDTAVERLEIARWALPDADLRVGGLVRGDALPFDNGTFDVVTASTSVHHGADRTAVLTELVRVVRPGGRVAVGGWVRPSGCWAEMFADHLRRLGLLAPATEAVELADGLDSALRAARLTVLASGDVRFRAAYPSIGAAWTAMLGSEQMLRAIRIAGERPVRDAFVSSVMDEIAVDGTVALPKAFRYAVATTPGVHHVGGG
jgi:SAM-dependent methyltransferase